MRAANETLDWLPLVERLAESLLGGAIGPEDLPPLCYCLREQQKLINMICGYLREQAAVIEGLSQDNQTLRAILADQDDPRPWDLGDERW
jgi:hypothetical protein